MIKILGEEFLLISLHCNTSSSKITKQWKCDWSLPVSSPWWYRLSTTETFSEQSYFGRFCKWSKLIITNVDIFINIWNPNKVLILIYTPFRSSNIMIIIWFIRKKKYIMMQEKLKEKANWSMCKQIHRSCAFLHYKEIVLFIIFFAW